MYGTPTRSSGVKRNAAQLLGGVGASESRTYSRAGSPRTRTPRLGGGRNKHRGQSLLSTDSENQHHRRCTSVASSATSGGGGRRAPSTQGGGSSVYDDEYRDFAPEASSIGGVIKRNTVLLRDEVLRVIVDGEVPSSVRQALQDADLYTQSFQSGLDPTTGFAFISTAETCVVWNYAKRTTSPTCYVFYDDDTLLFPLMNTSSTTTTISPAPFAAFVPPAFASATEPGLILAAPETGMIRYWENVSLALMPGFMEKASERRLDLGAEERVTGLSKIQNGIFAATTSSGRVFRLGFSSTRGRPQLQVEPFLRPSGSMFSLSRSTAALFGSALSEACTNLGSFITEEKEEDASVFVAAESQVQRWVVNRAGQKLTGEWDLAAGELAGVQSATVMDVAGVDSSRAAVLLAAPDDETGLRSFAVVVVAFGSSSEASIGKVDAVMKLGYKIHPDPRPIPGPRLIVDGAGKVAFAQFPAAIVTISLQADHPYEHITSFKENEDHAGNVVLGVGLTRGQAVGRPIISGPATTKLVLLSAKTGILGVDVGVDHLASSQPRSEDAQLEARIEQAVCFENARNPISFDLHAGFRGDLQRAVSAVSRRVVTGAIPMGADRDTTGDIEDRRERLRNLIVFIRQNGVLSDLSQEVKLGLSNDAEMMAAAAALWEYLNTDDRMSASGPSGLLVEAISAYMTEIPSQSSDPVRDFFRWHVDDLPVILHHSREVLEQKSGPKASLESRSQWQESVNGIFDAAHTAALVDAHGDNIRLYDIEPTRPSDVCVWLTDSAPMRDLRHVYHSNAKLLRERSDRFGSAIDEDGVVAGNALHKEQRTQAVLRDQLCSLVQPLAFALEEQARHAANRIAQRTDQGEAVLLKEEHLREADAAVMVLVPERTDLAYQMAEHHSLWATLVKLSTDSKLGDAFRVERYMRGEVARGDRPNKAKAERFADALFEYYLANGQLFLLLNQQPEYQGFLDDFFRRREHLPHLAFLHHLSIGNLKTAASDLLRAGANNSKIDARKTHFSLAKLSAIAAGVRSGDVTELEADLGAVEDELSLLGQTQTLRDLVLEDVSTGRRDTSAETLARDYMAKNARETADKPMRSMILYQIVRKLMEADCLSYDEVIDLLVLRDSYKGTSEDAVTTLKLFKQIPAPTSTGLGLSETRRSDLLRTIWRSIYLRDDWRALGETAHLTDEQVRSRMADTVCAKVIAAMQQQVGDISLDYLLLPDAAAYPPSMETLRTRTEGQDTESYLEEIQSEVNALRTLMDQTQIEQMVQSMVRATS